jgi:GT2 family glycosyltransferase
LAEAVSAAILNWNGGDLVVECLRSLLRQTHRIEDRIVVDNASTDGSLERLKAEDPGLSVISNARNLGFAAAANQAVAAAKGDWILLANLDVEFELDYVARLVAAGERDPMIGSVTGKLLRARADGVAPIVDSTGHILFRNGWAANRGEGLPDSGQWERPEEVFGVTAAAALYRVQMLREVSQGRAAPFDARFFAYIEDVDLDWRMRWLGWKAWYEPVTAWHRRSATGARRSAFILRHILKNRLLLVANNDLWPGGLLRIPGVAAFTVLAATQFGLEAPSSLLGVIDFLRQLPGSRQRRRFIKARKTVSSGAIARWMEPYPYRELIGLRLRHGKTRAALG